MQIYYLIYKANQLSEAFTVKLEKTNQFIEYKNSHLLKRRTMR